MPTSMHLSDGRQMDLLLDAGACEPSATALPRAGGNGRRAAVDRAGRAAGPRVHRRDRVTVDLRGLRTRLETRALQQQLTTAALVRRAVVLMLDDGDTGGAELERIEPEAGKVAKLTLRMSPVHALLLASRKLAGAVGEPASSGGPGAARPADPRHWCARLRRNPTDQPLNRVERPGSDEQR